MDIGTVVTATQTSYRFPAGITRTFKVAELPNDEGMVRVECIDNTADQFGTMGWEAEANLTVVETV